MSRQEIQEELELKDRVNFKQNYLDPALEIGVIELKYPDSPNHPKQKYLVTEKGKEIRNILFQKQ
jgi:ATP-dependent DNA helicase RecG